MAVNVSPDTLLSEIKKNLTHQAINVYRMIIRDSYKFTDTVQTQWRCRWERLCHDMMDVPSYAVSAILLLTALIRE